MASGKVVATQELGQMVSGQWLRDQWSEMAKVIGFRSQRDDPVMSADMSVRNSEN